MKVYIHNFLPKLFFLDDSYEETRKLVAKSLQHALNIDNIQLTEDKNSANIHLYYKEIEIKNVKDFLSFNVINLGKHLNKLQLRSLYFISRNFCLDRNKGNEIFDLIKEGISFSRDQVDLYDFEAESLLECLKFVIETWENSWLANSEPIDSAIKNLILNVIEGMENKIKQFEDFRKKKVQQTLGSYI